jgi:hypothetical protein
MLRCLGFRDVGVGFRVKVLWVEVGGGVDAEPLRQL